MWSRICRAELGMSAVRRRRSQREQPWIRQVRIRASLHQRRMIRSMSSTSPGTLMKKCRCPRIHTTLQWRRQVENDASQNAIDRLSTSVSSPHLFVRHRAPCRCNPTLKFKLRRACGATACIVAPVLAVSRPCEIHECVSRYPRWDLQASRSTDVARWMDAWTTRCGTNAQDEWVQVTDMLRERIIE